MAGRCNSIVAALTLGIAATISHAADREPYSNDFAMIQVAEGVHFLRSNASMSNPSTVVVKGTRAALVVDPGLDETAGVLFDWLAAHAPGLPILVATTHYHLDHAQASARLGHQALRLVPASQVDLHGLLQRGSGGKSLLVPKNAPWLEFDGSVTLNLGNARAQLREAPCRAGHTGADLLVHLPESGVLVVGDYYMDGKFPLIDVDGGGSLEGFMANLDWLAAAYPADTIVVPGHSLFPPALPRIRRMKDLREWAVQLRWSIDRIRALAASGLEAGAIEAQGPQGHEGALAERPRFQSFAGWVRTVLASRPAATPPGAGVCDQS